MSFAERSAGVLFWIMILGGGALLSPALVLPAWFEYQASQQVFAARAAEVEALRTRLDILRKQNEHKNDLAYLERLARQEFGYQPPGVETVQIDPVAVEQTTAALVQTGADDETRGNAMDRIATAVDDMMARYPITQVFVRDDLRLLTMGLGGGMVLTAVLLLGRRTPLPRSSTDAPEPSA